MLSKHSCSLVYSENIKLNNLHSGESEVMEVSQADKRALSRLLAGLVLCTVLTGFAAMTATSVAVSASNDSPGYEAVRVSTAATVK